ncbi:unnamed protein product [Effrenium voratum]|uniref:Uncharacterized protein n=1 Tax=Effrenium voratum TaxID=2562239 RepID=A0AA36HYM0_9DINO|nr:unnamed protein product [Effrenium voratum]
MGVETTKGRRSRGVRSRILLTAISWLFLHTVHLFTILHGRISPSRPGWKDSRGPQVTRWHPGRGGVASRASPQQDSGAEDWLAKSREEVEGFSKAQVSSWAEAVLIDGGLEADDEFIQRTVTALRQQGVTGKSLLELTLEKLMAAPYNIPGGPAELLTKKIQLLKEPQASASSSLKWVVDAKDTAFANELRMAQPLTALDCADENFTDVESAEDAGIEIFPLNASLDPKEAKPWLFVRKQQREVWQAAFNASQDVVVTGSPGIGKSFSMSFLFRDLMKAKKTFVFEARRWNMVYLFKPRTDGTYEVGSMQLEDWKPAACDELRVPANYYVIDPGEAEKGGVCFVAAKTVICPSPDPQHLGEFKKLPKCKLYMAACSLQEAQCIVKYLRPNFDQNQVEELYRRFGGILRHLIGDPKEVEMARNATLSNQNLVRQVWTSGIIDQGRDLKPAHWLFQIVPENGCTSSRVEFVSEEALDLTIHEYEAELADLLTSFDPLAKPVLGVLYERFAHQVLCRGTLLLTRLANVTVPMFEMRLPPLDEEVVDGSIADLFTAATTGQLRYMRPRDVGLPVIDSCLAPVEDGVMTCFQITVSAKHSLDLVALENAARGLDIAKIVIYWVVPRDSFREFNRKQTFGPQLVFEQRVLSLAAPRNPFTEQEMQERLQKAELSKLTTGDEQLLKQEIDDLKLRYLVMKSFEEQDVKDIMNKVLKEGKRAKNQDPVALRAARAWDKIVACMAWTKKRGECKLAA